MATVIRLFRRTDKVDDRTFGPNRRTELLSLFQSLLPQLSVASRSHLLTALQRTHTTSHPIAQTLIPAVLTSLPTIQCLQLKRQIDLNYGATDLHGLVWTALSAAVREQVLQYFQAQAKLMAVSSSSRQRLFASDFHTLI